MDHGISSGLGDSFSEVHMNFTKLNLYFYSKTLKMKLEKFDAYINENDI